jgi:GxxExxY protein
VSPGNGAPREFVEPDPELDRLAHIVIDAALEVHRQLGPGFTEAVYEQALALELQLRRIPFERQAPIAVTYKNIAIGHGRLDLLVAERLVVELKATRELVPLHVAQMLSYLKTTNHRLGLLINFNVGSLRHGVRRVILPLAGATPVR